VILWVKNRHAHVIARESGDRIPAGPEDEQGELHVPVTAVGAKEQRSLIAGGAQGLSDISAPKIVLSSSDKAAESEWRCPGGGATLGLCWVL
jgi:hypothetical protein